MGVEVKEGHVAGKERREFMKRLLRDVRALESLLETDRIERGVRRIGAEQELCSWSTALTAPRPPPSRCLRA